MPSKGALGGLFCIQILVTTAFDVSATELPAWVQNWQDPKLASGAQIEEGLVEADLFVARRHPNADDRNIGSPEQPLKTLQAAVDAAREYLERGRGVRIFAGPGIYRESVRLEYPEPLSNAVPLVIEAAQEDTVVISGSAIVNNWKINDDDFFEADWPWAGEMPSVGMVFAQGVRLVQVESVEDLRDGTFAFDAKRRRIGLLPPRNGVVRNGVVEVSDPTSGPLLSVRNLGNLVLRGLWFKHAVLTDNAAAVRLESVPSLLMDGCMLEHNLGGVSALSLRDATFQNVRWFRNGVFAFHAIRGSNYFFIGCRTELNGWRFLENTDEVFPLRAVHAIHASSATFQRCRFVQNTVVGLRLVQDPGEGPGSRLLDCYFLNNRTPFRFVQQPVAMRGGVVAFNETSGIVAAPVRFQNVVFHHNGTKAAFLGESAVIEPGASGNITMVRGKEGTSMSQLILENCLLTVENNDVPLLDVFGSNFSGSGNLYWANGGEPRFRFFDYQNRMEADLVFDFWRELTRSDMNSLVADPLLIQAHNYDFAPSTKSPVYGRRDWPVYVPQLSKAEALARLRAGKTSVDD